MRARAIPTGYETTLRRLVLLCFRFPLAPLGGPRLRSHRHCRLRPRVPRRKAFPVTNRSRWCSWHPQRRQVALGWLTGAWVGFRMIRFRQRDVYDEPLLFPPNRTPSPYAFYSHHPPPTSTLAGSRQTQEALLYDESLRESASGVRLQAYR
ncbi:hypothetical protein BDZ97DRAFT_1872706 [Flammula alnicola]|nr:hypothetical protein BDZ97DRAFT_1872706 [Flammula alnicola]